MAHFRSQVQSFKFTPIVPCGDDFAGAGTDDDANYGMPDIS